MNHNLYIYPKLSDSFSFTLLYHTRGQSSHSLSHHKLCTKRQKKRMKWRNLLDFGGNPLKQWDPASHISFHIHFSFSSKRQNKAKNDLPPRVLARNAVILLTNKQLIPPHQPISAIVSAFTCCYSEALFVKELPFCCSEPSFRR